MIVTVWKMSKRKFLSSVAILKELDLSEEDNDDLPDIEVDDECEEVDVIEEETVTQVC